MKRYETMSKEEIVEAFTTYKLHDNSCAGCTLYDWENDNHCSHRCSIAKGTCSDIIRAFLEEDVELVSRWSTVENDTNMYDLYKTWKSEAINGLNNQNFCEYLCGKVVSNA